MKSVAIIQQPFGCDFYLLDTTLECGMEEKDISVFVLSWIPNGDISQMESNDSNNGAELYQPLPHFVVLYHGSFVRKTESIVRLEDR